MSTENPLPPRATRTHPHLGMAHAYTPLAHLNKPAIFATPTRTTASPYQKLTNMSLLPRTGSSSSLHSLTRSPAFMKTRPSASPSPSPSASTSPSPFPSPMLGSSLSSLTTSALINAHLSSSHSSLSLSTLSSLTHSPVQSATSSGTIINILSKLNSTDVDDCAFDEVDAHAYTEVSSHSSSSSSSNNSTNGECEDEDVSHMYDYGGDGSHTSGHMDSIDSSVLSVSTSSSMMSNNAASSLSYMSFGGTSHYAPQQQDMNDEYPEAAKDVPTQHHTQSQHGSGSGTQSSTTTEDNLELESASALVAAQTTSSLSKTSSLMNLKQYNTRSRRASSDHIASPYLSPLLLAVMNNEHLSSLPALSFASPALSPSLGAFSQHGNGHRTTMATTQQQHQPIHDHASSAAAASHVPLSPMSSATSGMTSMPALSPLVSPQTSPMLGSRGLGSMSLASLSTMQAPWPTASPSSSPAHSGANHSYMVSGFHPQQPHHYYQQQQLLHQHHFSHTLPHYPTHPQMHPMGSMHPYQPAYYGHPHMAHGAHPHSHTHASLHEQVSVKLEPRLPMMQDTSPDMSVPRTQASVITAAAAAVRASMPPMEPSHGTKRKLDDAQEGEPGRVKKTIPKKSVKRRKKTGNESPSSDEQDEEVQATLSGDYKYQCTYESCGDCFKTRFSLKRHLKKHTGEKPYVCGIDGCDKTFAEKSTLKRHLRIHTGEKPYQCHVPGCGKLFADRTNVKRHEMIHTGERPYWCPFASCTRGYFWRKHLRKHVSSVHHANLSALSTYAKKNKQGEIIVGSGIVATAQTVPQSREAHGRVEEEDDILDDPDHEEPDEDDDEGMGGEAMEPSPRAKSKRVTTKKTRA